MTTIVGNAVLVAGARPRHRQALVTQALARGAKRVGESP